MTTIILLMGLFERQCMITGVSTGFAGAVAAVPLLEIDGKFRPVCLPVWGTYDGFGGIEAILMGPHAESCESALQELVHQGIITIEWKLLFEDPRTPVTLIEFLHLLSQSLVDGSRAITCNGRPMSFALFCAEVAEELLANLDFDCSAEIDLRLLASRTFGMEEPTSSIFSRLVETNEETCSSIRSALEAFAALDRWLMRRNFEWLPAKDAAQPSRPERRELLADARSRFADDPFVLHGLDRYECESGINDEE